MKRVSEKNNRILWQYVLPIIMLITYGVILVVRYDFYYSINDDPAMEEILSGLCTGTPDGHSWFHLYPLSWVLSKLYCIAPKVHWYGAFLWLCQMASLYACTMRAIGIWGSNKKRYVTGILVFALFVGLMLPNFVILTFTVVSGMLGATAVFLMTTAGIEAHRKGVIKQGLPAVGFYLISFCVRREMALLILPFLLISGVYFAFSFSEELPTASEKGNCKKILFCFIGLAILGTLTYICRIDFIIYVTLITGAVFTLYCLWIEITRLGKQTAKFITLLVILALTCGLTYGVHKVAYSGEEWKDYKAFVEARSGIYDFGTIPSYSENKEYYTEIGLSESEVSVLSGWDFMLSEKFDFETMSSIRDYKESIVSYRYYIYYVKKVILIAVNRFIGCEDLPLLPVLIALIGLAAVTMLMNKRYSKLIVLVFFAFGHLACWSYLTWLGRMLDRVINGLYLAEILLMLGICLTEMRDRVHQRICAVFAALIAVGALYAGVYRMLPFESDVPETGNYASKQEQAEFWYKTIEFCSKDPEKIYFLDTYTYGEYVTPVFGNEAIATTNRNGVSNMILAGHWIATSPLWYEKLDKLCGASSLQEVYDTGRECCFLVDSKWLTEGLQSYLTEHYPEMEIVRMDVK